MKVQIEAIIDIKNYLNSINKTDLNDIELYSQHRKIDIDQETIDEFKYAGLNNVDFIISEFYKRK